MFCYSGKTAAIGNNLVRSTGGTIRWNSNITLPQELIDTIIDLVAENDTSSFDDIKACSLTAHRFRPRTLSHLFRRLSFHRHTRWPQFLAFISDSPHIPPYYTVLKLISHSSSQAIQSLVSTTTLQRVLASLVNIQVLCLYWQWGAAVMDPSLCPYIVAMPLKEVHLRFCSLKVFAGFFKQIRVQVVSLEEVDLSESQALQALDRAHFVPRDAPAVLRELVLLYPEPAIVDAIAVGCIGPLRAVERLEYRGPNAPALTTFLDCRALKTLVLQVSVDLLASDGDSTALAPLSTAAYFPCLESLAIYLGASGRGLLLTWLMHCVTSHRFGPHLKHLSFEGYLNCTLHLSALTSFDKVLSENIAQYPDLKGLTIARGIREMDTVKEYLPKLMALGFILW